MHSFRPAGGHHPFIPMACSTACLSLVRSSARMRVAVKCPPTLSRSNRCLATHVIMSALAQTGSTRSKKSYALGLNSQWQPSTGDGGVLLIGTTMYVFGKVTRDRQDSTTTRRILVISGGWKPVKSHIRTVPGGGTKLIGIICYANSTHPLNRHTNPSAQSNLASGLQRKRWKRQASTHHVRSAAPAPAYTWDGAWSILARG